MRDSIPILLVEDDSAFRSLLARQLRSRGFEVFEAADGQAALEIFESAPSQFAIIVSDTNMPNLNGVDFLIKLRELSAVPVILMSGYSSHLERPELALVENKYFIEKPFSLDALVQLIKRALGLKT